MSFLDLELRSDYDSEEDDEIETKIHNPEKLRAIESELPDAVTYCSSLSSVLGIDLPEILQEDPRE